VRGLLFATVALASCYRPKLGNPGFFCRATDTPPCPEPQQCVAGRCVDPQVTFSGDGAAGDDLSTGADAGPQSSDLAGSDFAISVTDLSAPPDLTPACLPAGGDCNYHNDKACCSKYCIYATEKCK
jgi:hypothetical protein